MSSELHTLLDDGSAATPVGEGMGEGGSIAPPPPPPSPTVLATDRWTLRAGERVAAQWREAYDVDEVSPIVETMCDPHVAADAIETLLSAKPTLAERPENAHRARWWKQLLDSPEATSLRSRTVANAAIAEIAAAELAGQWSQYAAENPEPEPSEGDGEGGPDENSETPEQSVARIRSVRAALNSAAEAADAAESAGQGLGLGEKGATDAATLAKYTRRLRQSPNLAAIMRMAGRFIAKAQRLQRERSNLPGSEITGIELSGDLSRVLPSELAIISGAVPELQTLALVDLVENRSLSFKRQTRTPKQMGPIVVSIDESGSMYGERIAAAKGLALAMAGIARAQKRPFLLVAWSDGWPIRVVRDTDGPDAIVEWLEQMQNGGTNLKYPLYDLTTEAWPTGKVGAAADHILVTDAQVSIEPWLLDHYRIWAKATNVRTFGIAIGVRDPGALPEFCDGGTWALPSLDLDNPAVETVLSIGPTS